MNLHSICGEILDSIHGLTQFQTQELQTAFIAVMGEYDITKKEHCTDIIAVDGDSRAFTMYFVAKKVQGLSDKSLKYYRYVLTRFVQTLQKSLATYTSDDIRYYLAIRQMQDACSPVTANNERRVLSGFFNWLNDEGYISKNPCAQIKEIKAPKRKKKAFSDVEITKIKDACAKLKHIEAERAIALVEFMLSTGCRVGEIAPLKRENIDMENRTASVIGKGNKERTVYISTICKMRLVKYWELVGDNEFCFCNIDCRKKCMSISGIEGTIRKIGAAAGVTNCHPHRFRRTCATSAIKRGMPLLDVQRMLGHESTETTRIYLDLDDTDLRYQHDRCFV